jgi:hypothetical protein
MASVAHTAAKLAARLARAKKVHDDLIAAAFRARADALEIEALAKRRLADEYDAAQERGEVVGRKGGGSTLPDRKGVTSADVGLTYKEIHEARQIRGAEKRDPGLPENQLQNYSAVEKRIRRAYGRTRNCATGRSCKRVFTPGITPPCPGYLPSCVPASTFARSKASGRQCSDRRPL